MKKLGQTFVDEALLIRASKTGAVVTFLVGAGALAGWAMDVPWLRALPFGELRAATVKPNSAMCLCFSGISLWLAHSGPRGKSLAKTLGLLVAAVGATTLVEYLFATDLGIDSLLFRSRLLHYLETSPSPGGRMALATAIDVTLSGI